VAAIGNEKVRARRHQFRWNERLTSIPSIDGFLDVFRVRLRKPPLYVLLVMSAIIPQADSHTPPQSAPAQRPRTFTNTAEIDNTIIHPGSVKINVQGAFIVDQEATTPNGAGPNGGSHDTKDIRLPNHTAVVSHIAVDVSPRYVLINQCITNFTPDWGFPGQARLLFPRTAFNRTRWTIKFHKL
jgi:hypothetical protein